MLVFLFERNMWKQKMYTYIIHIIDTRQPESNSIMSWGFCLKKDLVQIGTFLEHKLEGEDAELIHNEFSWGNHSGLFTFCCCFLAISLSFNAHHSHSQSVTPPFIFRETLQRTNLAFWMPFFLQMSYCNKWGESDAPFQNSYWYLFYQSQSSSSQRDGNA